tara:strand:+ start:38 stop:175 length:138 start_codon:yes stop_codon:yes gene_type:complete
VKFSLNPENKLNRMSNMGIANKAVIEAAKISQKLSLNNFFTVAIN